MGTKLHVTQLLVAAIFFVTASAYIDIILDKVECVGDPNFVDCGNSKVKRNKKERLVYGKVDIKSRWENSITCEMTAYKKQGGEYRLMPYTLKKGLCDFFQNDQYFYDDFCENSTFIKPFPCPYPAGEYSIDGYTPSLKNMPAVIIPSGDYRLELKFVKELKEVAKGTVWASVIQL